MRTAVATSLLIGLTAVAAQQIDYSLAGTPIEVNVPSTGSEIVTFDIQSATKQVSSAVQAGDDSTNLSETLSSSSSSSSKRRRTDDACAPQPTGAGPTPYPDTPQAFENDPYFSTEADLAFTPKGYTLTFQNLNASNNANGYMGYTLLDSYDVQGCAAACNAIYGCEAINIYFERDPSIVPGDGCPNPPSTTNIKCVFWGGPVTLSNAINYGQYRDEFEVVIAGSNGYVNNTIECPSGYQDTTLLGDVAINAPLDCLGVNTYIGTSVFLAGPFDATLCAAACTAQRTLTALNPTKQACNFFNTYLLNKNGASVGQYCVMYSEAWDGSYATNPGSTKKYKSAPTTGPKKFVCIDYFSLGLPEAGKWVSTEPDSSQTSSLRPGIRICRRTTCASDFVVHDAAIKRSLFKFTSCIMFPDVEENYIFDGRRVQLNCKLLRILAEVSLRALSRRRSIGLSARFLRQSCWTTTYGAWTRQYLRAHMLTEGLKELQRLASGTCPDGCSTMFDENREYYKFELCILVAGIPSSVTYCTLMNDRKYLRSVRDVSGVGMPDDNLATAEAYVQRARVSADLVLDSRDILRILSYKELSQAEHSTGEVNTAAIWI
ncbi:hypothetical protein F5Y16DRAFT_419478 [Xylariaceae sp. FL0255]|nr:hypothetical protein F5Y16DRAFT_419478 [Xylariaceae sp. FL0255]